MKWREIGRSAALPALAVAAGALAVPDGRAAEAGTLRMRCVNNTGGANWPISVDLEHGRVDAFPATITAAEIAWRDEKGGIYELDRASGRLRLRAASSTGGYFLYYTCKPE